jgi:hypothetical protein
VYLIKGSAHSPGRPARFQNSRKAHVDSPKILKQEKKENNRCGSARFTLSKLSVLVSILISPAFLISFFVAPTVFAKVAKAFCTCSFRGVRVGSDAACSVSRSDLTDSEAEWPSSEPRLGRPPGGGVIHLRGGRGGKLGGRGRGARGEEGAVGSRTSMGAVCSSGAGIMSWMRGAGAGTGAGTGAGAGADAGADAGAGAGAGAATAGAAAEWWGAGIGAAVRAGAAARAGAAGRGAPRSSAVRRVAGAVKLLRPMAR